MSEHDSTCAVVVSEGQREEWRVSPLTEGKYEASSLGRIRNRKTGRVLKLRQNQSGYLCFAVYFGNSRQSPMFAHRAVASAFIGEPTPERPFVNHKDFNRKNNAPENLEWVSAAENTRHSNINGRYANRYSAPAKLTPEIVEEICKLRDEGYGWKRIAKAIDFPVLTIRDWRIQGKIPYPHPEPYPRRTRATVRILAELEPNPFPTAKK